LRVIGSRAAMMIRTCAGEFLDIDRRIKPVELEHLAPKRCCEVAFKNSYINLLNRLLVNVSDAADSLEVLRINILVELYDFLVQGAIGLGQHGQTELGLLTDVSEDLAELVVRPFDRKFLRHSKTIRQSLDFDDFLANTAIGFTQEGL